MRVTRIQAHHPKMLLQAFVVDMGMQEWTSQVAYRMQEWTSEVAYRICTRQLLLLQLLHTL